MRLNRLIRETFAYGNTSVVGLRGRGKDMLISNVIARRRQPYISNVDYCCARSTFIPLDLSKFDLHNNYENFINNNISSYKYPYSDNIDIYISDTGVYFPSQYNGSLNNKFPSFPTFMALSRQLGLANVHTNCQNLTRVWDKIREQSDIYILCNSCKVLFGRLVIQRITIYDNADSCQRRVEPFRPLRVPLFSKDRQIIKSKNEELKRGFLERNGRVRRRTLIYLNRSNYNTRLFKTILEGNCEENVEN